MLLCAALFLAGAGRASAEEFDSDGVKIHYIVQGGGEPVILVHGLYSSALVNWELPGTAKELSRHFQVIMFDNRGHGQSGKPKEEDQYGVKMVDDVVNLMDHLHIAKARVVGYSLGGMMVMKLLALHPDRVQSAVLGGMGWLKEGSPLQRFWNLAANGRRAGMVPPACLRGIARLAVTREEVQNVRVPVTIIVGDHDPCRSLYVDPLRAIRPDWPVRIIPDAGHLNCIVKPEFKAELLSALQSNITNH